MTSLQKLFVLLLVAASTSYGFANDSTGSWDSTAFDKTIPLTIDGLTEQPLQFSPQQLHSFADMTTVKILHDPAFGGTEVNYLAVPFKSLLKKNPVNKEATIEFICMDNYNAVLDAKALLNSQNVHQAYVAFATEDGKPIPRNAGHKAIGPYYLVWPNPKEGRIVETNWPYNLKSFKIINKSFKEQFPGLFSYTKPETKEKQKTISEGLEVFRTNCFVCHKMNDSGRASMGIDLKFSPFASQKSAEELIEFVRDPQKFMPGISMTGFTVKMLSTDDLKKVIQYLKYMQDQGQN